MKINLPISPKSRTVFRIFGLEKAFKMRKKGLSVTHLLKNLYLCTPKKEKIVG